MQSLVRLARRLLSTRFGLMLNTLLASTTTEMRSHLTNTGCVFDIEKDETVPEDVTFTVSGAAHLLFVRCFFVLCSSERL